jgi:MFS family permease
MTMEPVEGAGAAPTVDTAAPVFRSAGVYRSLRAFRHPAFRVVWFAYLASQAGFWIGFISLQWLMARLTGGDALAQGELFFFNFAPIQILSLPSGLLADRFDRRTLAIIGQLSVASVAALLAFLTFAHLLTVPILLGVAVLLGSAGAIGGPVGQAVFANSVPPADIGSAVSLQAAGMNLGRISGPALVAPILIAFGAAPAFAITAFANLVTAGALFRTRLNAVRPAELTGSRLRQILDGFTHAAERPPALIFLLMIAVNMLFATSYVAVLPTFAYEVLKVGDLGFSTLVVATGAGAAIGAVVSGFREGTARVRTVALVMMAQAVALLGLAISRNYPASLLLAVLLGALTYSVLTSISASLQYLADEQKRGRLMAAYQLVGPGAVPVGGLLLAALAHAFGPPQAVAAFAMVAGVFSLGVVLWRSREALPSA